MNRKLAAVLLALAAPLCTRAAPAPAGAEQSQARFDVLEYRVLGNTAIPSIEVERVLYPRTGTEKTIADVEQARADPHQVTTRAEAGSLMRRLR